MIWRRLKTFILVILVITSLVTSYAIWHGTWMVHSEVGVSEPQTSTPSPTSPVPDLDSVIRPQQVVVASGQPKVYSVDLPGSSNYGQWMKMLDSMSVTPLRLVNSVSVSQTSRCAVFDFAVTVNPVQLTDFIPALATTAFAPATDEVMLFVKPPMDKVQFAIQTDMETYIGTTNISVDKFTELIQGDVQSLPWHLLSDNPWSLVPQRPLAMPQYRCTLSQPKLSPLVNSFFVNTQVLTRIQENQGTVIWTDGSRAVQWDSQNQQLTFDDPNAVSAGPAPAMSLSNVLLYVSSHGGIPQSSLVYTNPSASEVNFYFVQTVAGLPILNPVQQYRILFEQGHIIEYDRPLVTIAGLKSLGAVKTVNYSQLTAAVNHAGYDLGKVQVTLGYQLQPDGHDAGILTPVYDIENQGSLAAVVDAITGQLLEGGIKS